MRKIFVLLLVASSFTISENASAWPWNKKDDDSARLGKIVSEFNNLSKQAASTSTSIDSYTQKNYLSEEDISSLLALRVVTKNVSEFFNWLYILTDQFKKDFDSLQKAQKNKESAKSENSVSKAEDAISTSQDKIGKITEVILGNGAFTLLANTKAAASIFLQVIKQVEFSPTNAAALKKNMSTLRNKCDAAGTAVKPFMDVFQKAKEISNVDIDESRAAKLIDGINVVIEVLVEIYEYFNKSGLEESTITGLLDKCSLAGKGSEDRGNNVDSANSDRDDDYYEEDNGEDSYYEDNRNTSRGRGNKKGNDQNRNSSGIERSRSNSRGDDEGNRNSRNSRGNTQRRQNNRK